MSVNFLVISFELTMILTSLLSQYWVLKNFDRLLDMTSVFDDWLFDSFCLCINLEFVLFDFYQNRVSY